MGSNFANDLATLGDMGIALDIESQIGIHLRSNCYPPVPLIMVAPAIEAIDAVNDAGLWNLDIPLPEGVLWKDLTTAPAHAIIEGLRLNAWIIEREEY